MSNTTPAINVGALSEALNDKADLDMDNISPATLSAKIAPLLESLGGVGGKWWHCRTRQIRHRWLLPLGKWFINTVA